MFSVAARAMSEDYQLHKEVPEISLIYLNSKDGTGSMRIRDALSAISYRPSLYEVEDWIAALKSGKVIVNPLSPREQFRKMFRYLRRPDENGEHEDGVYRWHQEQGVIKAVEIIAKEHPDVADWIKDDDPDD